MRSVDVAIVGAGAAGLAAARHLRTVRPDLTLQLLEAGRRIGGRARTIAAGTGAWPIDLGCGWLHGARDNAWTDIATTLGFELDDALAPWDGAGRDLGSTEADEAEAEAALRRFFDRADACGSLEPDVPLSELLETGCRWNGFIGAIGTFINGVELDRASLHDLDRYDPGRGPDRRVREGYGRLIGHFGVGLPIACETPVEAVDHSGHWVVLRTSRGNLEAAAVIVTVPTSVLAAEAIRFSPTLPDKVEAAAALPLGVANKLFLAIPDGVVLPVETHVLGSARRTRTAAYHVGPFGRPLIECYFGGDLAREMERDRESAVAFTRSELAGRFGADVARRLEPIAATAWAAEPHIGGSYSYAKPGAADARKRLAVPVDERLFFAGEACSPTRFSTAHGAYESGVAAAEAVALAAGRR